MPCDAIATIKADIKDLEKLLTPENILNPLQQYCWQKFHTKPELSINKDTLQARLGNILLIIKGSQITVSGADKASNNRIAQELAQFLKRLAGTLIQKRVLEAVRQKGQINSATITSNRALVIKARI
jgi:hypothetical protein